MTDLSPKQKKLVRKLEKLSIELESENCHSANAFIHEIREDYEAGKFKTAEDVIERIATMSWTHF